MGKISWKGRRKRLERLKREENQENGKPYKKVQGEDREGRMDISKTIDLLLMDADDKGLYWGK